MAEVSLVAAAIAWGLLPGLALLYALDLDWSAPERVAASAGLSLALVSCAAYAAELLGLQVTPLPVLSLAALLCALVFLLRWGLAPPAPAMSEAAAISADGFTISRGWPRTGRPGDKTPPGHAASWDARLAPWLVLLLPLVIVSQLEPVTTLPLLPPSLHDGLDHANWFRLIYETRSLNPHEVLAPPLGPDGAPTYYPWGMHAWLALLAHTTTLNPVTVLTQGLALMSAALPLSIYVFTAHLTGRGWTAMAAAALSLGFWWLPYQVWSWGGYPLLAGAVAALPLCRLALWAVERRHLAGLAAAAACALGVLLIHPSQVMLALLIACVVSTTLAASQALPWRVALSFVLMLAAVGVVLSVGAGLLEPVQAFMERARAIGADASRDPRFAWPLGLYANNRMQFPSGSWVTFGVLCVLGAGFALVDPRARPFLALHVALSLLVPLAQHLTWVTGLWYHLPERLWYAQYASLPALAAVGIGGVIRLLAILLRRWIDLARWQFVAWPVALVLVMTGFGDAYQTWSHVRLRNFSLRNAFHTVTDRRLLADFEWMCEQVPDGEIIFNAPGDWGLPLPFTGHRTIFWSGGYAVDPATNWNRLLNLLRRGDPFTSHAAAELRWRGIRYIYAATLDPALQAGGRIALDADVLRTAAGLEPLYESPTATVLRARDEGAVLLGLRDSDRITFRQFHPVERLGDREWRWSAGRGRLRIRTAAGEACHARIFGADPDDYVLTARSERLELTPRGFRLPPPSQDGVVDVVLEPASGKAPPRSPGETRELGVRVRDVALACGPAGS